MSTGSKQPPRIPLTIICLFILLCTFVPPGNTADYYVDNDAPGAADSPSNGLSAALPWQTLHYAVTQLAAGDTLHVLPSIYSIANGESDTNINVSVSAVIVGEPFGQAIVDGSGSASWTNGIGVSSIPTGVKIEGLVIKNFNHGIDVNNSSPEILNNILVDNAVGIYVMANVSPASPTIINNLIYEDISNAMTYGIQITGISTGGTNASEIYHNTIDGGTTDGIYIDRDVDSIIANIRYNNITGFPGYGINYIDPVSAGSVVAYNNIFGNGTAYNTNLNTFVSNSISLDPGYADPANGDYHLPPTSNSVDQIPGAAGDPVTHDQDGKARILPYDIGCYEFADTYTLTVTVTGNGQVTSEINDIDCPGDCTETAIYGTVFRLTPTPEAGYSFDYWDVDGTQKPDNPIDIFMDQDIQATAVFASLNLPEHTSNQQIFPAGTTSIMILADNFFSPSLTSHLLSHWQVRREDRKSYNNGDYDSSFTADTDTHSGLTAHVVNGLITGMVYVWKVGYEDSDGTVVWSDEFSFAVGDSTPLPVMSIPGGVSVANYRMVSFPIWTTQSLPDLLRIACDRTLIRLGSWDPVMQGYIECGPDLNVTPGRAYWILSRNDLQKTSTGIAVTTVLEVEVELLLGWNMIACPNARTYTWGNVQLLESDMLGGVVFGPTNIGSLTDTTYIDPVLWRWENGSYAADTVQMSPYQGYWVKANRDNLFLKFPETAVSAAGFESDRFSSRIMEDSNQSRNQLDLQMMETPPMPMGNDAPVEKGGCFMGVLGL